MKHSYDAKCEVLARYFMADGEIQPEEAIKDLAQTIQDAIELWFVGWDPLQGKHVSKYERAVDALGPDMAEDAT